MSCCDQSLQRMWGEAFSLLCGCHSPFSGRVCSPVVGIEAHRPSLASGISSRTRALHWEGGVYSFPGTVRGHVLCDIACHLVWAPTEYTVAGTILGSTSAWGATVSKQLSCPPKHCAHGAAMATYPCLRVPRACGSGVAPTVSTLGPQPSHWARVDDAALTEDAASILRAFQLWPRPHSRPFRLPLCSQTKSFPQVWLLKSEFQNPGTGHPADTCLGLGSQ